MKTIIFGSAIFVVWSAVSTYYYVCQIKGICADGNIEQAVTIANIPTEQQPQEPEAEPVYKLESPGTFTVYHNFDQIQFIEDEQFTAYIQDLNTYLIQEETLNVSVVGYTDYIGPATYNNELGLKRASFTKNYMVNNGLDEERILCFSRGESSPVSENDTSVGRAKNRRTEISITN
ncbi:MAG TPA: hypothetical protein DDY13_20445 [Cytophagales bacterium]|jgi:outer membrane protein OmpA-like peptidoglycan-associated protein|nr:hypothetical protein [Cytophagales bacterium]